MSKRQKADPLILEIQHEFTPGHLVRRQDVSGYSGSCGKGDAGLAVTPPRAIFKYDNEVRLPAITLKEIYESLNDAPSYAGLCERLGFSPLDCERLAKMELAAKHW